ncbi:MAG: DUF1552 domain-containing protein [Myxococcota bacterium]|nr:DUF1552 domain-containing protein [Myxococcota bacterium]
MTRGTFGRRLMLRGALGTVIGLPLLEHMLNENGDAYADGGALPCRYFLMHTPTALVVSGSRAEAMTPTRAGFDYDVTPVLTPLGERGVASDVSIVSGLFAPPIDAPGGYNVDYHGQAVYAVMTGMRSGWLEPTWRPQALSPDQLIAQAIGERTRLPFLYYQLDPNPGGHQVCYEEVRGFSDEPEFVFRGITPQVSPASAYRSLVMEYVPATAPDPRADLERRLRVSSLSYARDEITRLQGRLGAADRRTLDEHLTRMRALETRLADLTPSMGAGCADPMHPDSDPADLATDLPDQRARASLYVDLIEMAFACDITRTVTLGGASGMTGPGMRHEQWSAIGGLHGEVQHASAQENLDAANGFFVDVYAQVLERLKASVEGTGNVLDRTVAVFAMEGGKGLTRDDQRSGDGGGDPNHSVDHALMMIAGRAGGLRSGQHVVLTGRDLHPAVVLNTALRAMGVAGTLGEITGTVDELF